MDNTAEEETAGDELTFLIMRIGPKQVAVPVHSVEEVAQMPAVSLLPDSATAIIGLVDYHGRKLTVIDLAVLLGMTPNPVLVEKTLAVFSLDSYEFAVMIDEATDVVTAPRLSMQVSDEALPGAIRSTGVITLSNSQSIPVFDVGSIARGGELRDSQVTR